GVGEFAADEQAMAGGAGVEGGDEIELKLAPVVFAILSGGAAVDRGAVDVVGGDRGAVHGLDAGGVVEIVESAEAHREDVVEAIRVFEKDAMNDVLAPVQRRVLAEVLLAVDREHVAGAFIERE